MADTIHDYSGISISRIHREVPTAQLRFFNGVLQQYWTIEMLDGGIPKSFRSEWRDVPQEKSE